MDNYLVMKKSGEAEKLSKSLGFNKTFFVDEDFVILSNLSQKDLLKQASKAKQKKLKVVYKPESEEMLRFALEKAPIDVVFGAEKINLKDSLHFLRGGLDQVTCKIASEKEKNIGFSFRELMDAQNKGRLLGRMKLNASLCRKYRVKMDFLTLFEKTEEMRSAKDLQLFQRLLGI